MVQVTDITDWNTNGTHELEVKSAVGKGSRTRGMAVQRNIQFANIKQILTFLFVISCGSIRHGCGIELFSCEFGTNTAETYCGMNQSQRDDFDWKLISTSGNPNTGPQADHTGNPNGAGRFLWADSSIGGGKRTTILTPAFNLTNDHGFLTFYYYLYGTGQVGSLEVRVCDGGDPVWTISGNQDMEWKEQTIATSCDSNMTQVSFTAQISSKTSDIAIDDVVISITSLTTESATLGVSTGYPVFTKNNVVQTVGKTEVMPSVTLPDFVPLAETSTGQSPSRPQTDLDLIVGKITTVPNSSCRERNIQPLGVISALSVVITLCIGYGVVITIFYIRLRVAFSRKNQKPEEGPYIDLGPSTHSIPTTYESMVISSLTSDSESRTIHGAQPSYENQKIADQNQRIHPTIPNFE